MVTMTPFIFKQITKICDNPEWLIQCFKEWDFKSENESRAIKNLLSKVCLNGVLTHTHIIREKFIHDQETTFLQFQIPNDQNIYRIFGVLNEDGDELEILLIHSNSFSNINLN